MKKKRPLKEIWKQVPPDYYERGITINFLQRLWHNHKFKILHQLTHQKKFKKILDIGCAGGLMTNKIATFFPDSQVIGIDVYKEAITFAKSKYPQITFKVVDAHNLPFPNNSYDLIICYETIEHVINPGKVLKEIRRVAKKDSLIIIAMDSGSLLFRFIWWFWEKSFGKVWQEAHLNPFHHQYLEQKIKNAGFKIKNKHFSHLGMEVSFVLKK